MYCYVFCFNTNFRTPIDRPLRRNHFIYVAPMKQKLYVLFRHFQSPVLQGSGGFNSELANVPFFILTT